MIEKLAYFWERSLFEKSLVWIAHHSQAQYSYVCCIVILNRWHDFYQITLFSKIHLFSSIENYKTFVNNVISCKSRVQCCFITTLIYWQHLIKHYCTLQIISSWPLFQYWLFEFSLNLIEQHSTNLFAPVSYTHLTLPTTSRV